MILMTVPLIENTTSSGHVTEACAEILEPFMQWCQCFDTLKEDIYLLNNVTLYTFLTVKDKGQYITVCSKGLADDVTYLRVFIMDK